MLKLKIVQKYNKVLKFILITTSNKQKTRQNNKTKYANELQS